ncbi:chemotaxis protein MotC [Rhizobium sp. LC145]|uniref:chemotaxis protein MotC n=1 Tax=Rhizobium sp. LC145 TaxID=1120688 RepID=UPI001FDAC765|nr:chemotaxis protein MotC [Rhizobium sp. LC145]
MMASAPLRILAIATLLLGTALTRPVFAQDHGDLAPHSILRSLQFVQDSVVLGDHSAGEMQRFLLAKMDERLRTADPSVFDDPRNVDAALIYAMSGGNPATLEYLASRDVAGNFDSRVADALRKYLSGKGTLVAKSMGAMATEYRDQKIGPYLALVSGNVSVANDPKEALAFYDWARLTAPGTIVEEAALRRSVAISLDAGLVDQGVAYSRKYARRFVHSPYASQFVDLFVDLVVKHYGQIHEEDLDATVAFMDADRRREVFLRIARAAAIAARSDLARLASERAEALAGAPTGGSEALARLYGGLANIPTGDVAEAMRSIADIPQEDLSPRDRALREAARTIAEQMLNPPTQASLGQAIPVNMNGTDDAGISAALPGDEVAGPAASGEVSPDGRAVEIDPEFQTFVDSGRSKLSAIDDLLKEEDP